MLEEFRKNIDLDLVSNQTLAFIGDSVYDLYIRCYLSGKSNFKTGILHKQAIGYVSARAQAKIIDILAEDLSEDEIEVYKRGRNSHIPTVSKNVDVVEYKKATGFEALIGYLYVKDNVSRIDYIVKKSIEIIEKEG